MDMSSTSKDSKDSASKETCVNRYCTYGDELVPVIRMVCIFYHVRYRPHKMVCSACLDQCLSHHRSLVIKMKNGKCIMEGYFSDDDDTDTDDYDEETEKLIDDDEEETENLVNDDDADEKTEKLDDVDEKTEKLDDVGADETEKLDDVGADETEKLDDYADETEKLDEDETEKLDDETEKLDDEDETEKLDDEDKTEKQDADVIEKQDDDEIEKQDDDEIEKQDDDGTENQNDDETEKSKPSTSKEDLSFTAELLCITKHFFDKYNHMLEQIYYNFITEKIVDYGKFKDDVNALEVETNNKIRNLTFAFLTKLGPVDLNKLDEKEDSETEKKEDNIVTGEDEMDEEDFPSVTPKA